VTRGVDPPEVEGYQWDGSKLIMIAKLNSNGTFHSRKWSCVWRPDVGSSLYARSDWMRAGGVGGVAWLQTGAVQSYSYGTGSAEAHVPLADHMGNVRHYYQFKASGSKVIGQLVASYEYDAFGREVRAWGLNTPATNQPPGLPASRPWADLLPFHYSSKLRDVDSGFNYYGYRFYDPGAGRWLNRDPIGERGGVNLYGMVGNDAVGRVDVLGLCEGLGQKDDFQIRLQGLGGKEAGPKIELLDAIKEAADKVGEEALQFGIGKISRFTEKMVDFVKDFKDKKDFAAGILQGSYQGVYGGEVVLKFRCCKCGKLGDSQSITKVIGGDTIDEHEVSLGAKEGQAGYRMTNNDSAKAFADSLFEAVKEAAEEAYKTCK
jgi:RHS repeat-associated protein